MHTQLKRRSSVVSAAAILFPGFGVIAQIEIWTVNSYAK